MFCQGKELNQVAQELNYLGGRDLINLAGA
jgi:hypothetical protein